MNNDQRLFGAVATVCQTVAVENDQKKKRKIKVSVEAVQDSVTSPRMYLLKHSYCQEW